ncbi:PREDICTED: uncharacterized protein LOC105450730 [Wasmannia auropunctata]|uniref:uncharacterized protein LOC105450730 n=1 Tax=Wasmannia auropunctata TaxID=64793 RepID=UPI0005EFBC9B|nr:PREDICTED: uncharacterized protein LOC105450730 [Wasmannia auropunctata]
MSTRNRDEEEEADLKFIPIILRVEICLIEDRRPIYDLLHDILRIQIAVHSAHVTHGTRERAFTAYRKQRKFLAAGKFCEAVEEAIIISTAYGYTVCCPAASAISSTFTV